MTTDSRAGEGSNLYITIARTGINMAAWKHQQPYLLQVVLNWSAREQEEEFSIKLRAGRGYKLHLVLFPALLILNSK